MAVDRYQNSTNYVHPQESNLLNVHKAMAYNSAGEPSLRTVRESVNKTAFGESYGITIVPRIQLAPAYGLDSLNYVTTVSNINAAVTSENSHVKVVAGPTVAGVPTISIFRSKKFFRYRAGQGALGRWNTAFSAPYAGSEQRAGFFNFEEALQFTYNGTEFGILHIRDKRMRIVQFRITTPPVGTSTVTVTLDNVPYVFTVSGTANQVAQQIASHTGYNPLFLVEAVTDTVTFIYLNNGAADTGVFTITGNSGIVIAKTSVREPNLGEEYRYPQAQWSVDPLDGTGPSGSVLNPTNFNVYQISLSWLGSGKIDFFVENPSTGELILVHQIIWVNRHRVLNTISPSFAVGAGLFNFAPANTLELLFGSMMMANEGTIEKTTFTRAVSVSKTNLANNTLHHLVTLRNPYRNDTIINYLDVVLKSFTVSIQANDPVEIFMYVDAPLASGTHEFTRYTGNSTVTSTATGTIADTVAPIAVYVIEPNGSGFFDLTQNEELIPVGSTLTLAVRSGQTISRISAATIWLED